MNPLHLYIHWPFCKSKCPYCDFNSHVRVRIDESEWLEGYLREIDYFADYIRRYKIKTIFFGGGTPSLMSPDTAKAIIDKLRSISYFDNIEITLEANPTSSESSKFKEFKESGINRLSIGIQSLIDEQLKFLGRNHSSKEATQTIEMASKIFDNYSFDLIYARPDQTEESWKSELNEALSYAANHISLYQLTIEKGTPFYKDARDKKFTLPDQDKALDLYDITTEILENKGLMRYEISNYALPGKESQHNLGYWNYREYLGIGAGAHSRIKKDGRLYHIMTTHNPEKWLELTKKYSNGIQQNIEMKDSEIVSEALLMGLRLQNGINLKRLKTEHGIDPFKFILKDELKLFEKEGFLQYNKGALSLTNSGKLLLNRIVSRLLI
jgi:putative oxygen-independent coproporphyrinogen III oxidase